MKHPFTPTILRGASALVVAAALTSVLFAAENPQGDVYEKIFSKVPPPEIAPKAAELVANAPASEQKSVAIAVVRAAVQKKPVCARFVVSAVARAVPSVAAVAAATAAAMEPKQAGQISKAAVAAAPSRAGEIVSAISKELPASYGIVAIGASEAAPAANHEILAAVSQAVPSVKPYVDEASKAPRLPDGYASTMVGIIQRTETLAGTPPSPSVPLASVSSTPRFAPPPPQRPPFTPGAGHPGETNRNQTVVVQPGQGRIYSGP